MDPVRCVESAEMSHALRDTLRAVPGLSSITVSTDEGNELLSVSTDAAAPSAGAAAPAGSATAANRDRTAIFAGASEQVQKLGRGPMRVTTAYYENQVVVLTAVPPLIISVVGDAGVDVQAMRRLVGPLGKLVQPLKDAVAEVAE
jgi:hypothetical protein